ncbi:MAG: DUF4349 domain-containing protein [Erythrobacter sp.]|nr:DUF4349 domain-containing protein [Erythrobacter sp.]NCQ62584.1 DUF4349 domain-containing protein [Alphaproteobacteria bacterium]
MAVRRSLFFVSAAAIALAACSEGETYESVERLTTADVTEEAAMEAPPPPGAPEAMTDEAEGDTSALPDIPAAAPKIAYVYAYGFRVPREDIAPLQERHADMCIQLGPLTCQVRSLQQNGAEDDYGYGELQISVAADKAREFGRDLVAATETAGGDQVSSSIEGEDLSKQIVDTEARLRSREVLRDRLMEVLRTRKGSVQELVEAERGVAQVNEEIDQARSWLQEMRGRVAYSRVTVTYQSETAGPGGFFEPIRKAIGSIGPVAGTVIGGLILLLTIFVPIGLVGYGIWLLIRRLRRRDRDEATPAD